MTTALLYTFATGTAWIFLGIFLSIISRKSTSIINMAILYNALSIIPALFLLKHPGELFSGNSPVPDFMFLLLIGVGGAVNTAGMLFLQYAMRYGKNGPAWAIGQSALVIPLLSMYLIFHEALSPLKFTGAGLILTGMFLLSLKDKQKQTEGAPLKSNWILLALTAFAVLGTAQSMLAASAYTNYRDPHHLRPLLVLFGSFITLVGAKVLLREKGFAVSRNMLRPLAGVTVSNIAGLILLFMSIDAMGRLNLASAVYPLAVGFCIAGFSLYALFFLKEKATSASVGGIILILCGISGFCF